jgi:hypothetical protein
MHAHCQCAADEYQRRRLLAGVTVAAFGASGLRALVIWRSCPFFQLPSSLQVAALSANRVGTPFA